MFQKILYLVVFIWSLVKWLPTREYGIILAMILFFGFQYVMSLEVEIIKLLKTEGQVK